MAEIKHETSVTLVSIPSDTDGWNIEVSLVSWNGREPKWDIRKWDRSSDKCGKGVTLSNGELVRLFEHAGDVLEAFVARKAEPQEEQLPFK